MEYKQPIRGIRKPSALVNTVAATPVTLYQRSAGGQNPRTVIVRKIMAFGGAGNAILQIGTGLAPFAAIFPSLFVVAGHDAEWTEDELPEVEVGADITMNCDVGNVVVQVEVEEIE
jgi:hypothetical protein